jgi:hypothetical protein
MVIWGRIGRSVMLIKRERWDGVRLLVRCATLSMSMEKLSYAFVSNLFLSLEGESDNRLKTTRSSESFELEHLS